MSISAPLGLQDLFVNTIAGTMQIFVFLMIIFISALSAKFNMPRSIYLLMITLFALFFAEFLGGLYLIVILIAGFIIFSAIQKVT